MSVRARPGRPFIATPKPASLAALALCETGRAFWYLTFSLIGSTAACVLTPWYVDAKPAAAVGWLAQHWLVTWLIDVHRRSRSLWHSAVCWWCAGARWTTDLASCPNNFMRSRSG